VVGELEDHMNKAEISLLRSEDAGHLAPCHAATTFGFANFFDQDIGKFDFSSQLKRMGIAFTLTGSEGVLSRLLIGSGALASFTSIGLLMTIAGAAVLPILGMKESMRYDHIKDQFIENLIEIKMHINAKAAEYTKQINSITRKLMTARLHRLTAGAVPAAL
jgi:hypothetical protein